MNRKKIPSFIEHNETLSSTNDRAWEILLREGADADMGVVTADFQEKGRGRAGRNWFAGKGGSLLMSLILAPCGVESVRLLPLAAGISVIRALGNCAGIDARLKWPNDIIFDGKKMGGILVETRTSGEDLLGAVVGIGLNLEGESEVFPDELRAKAVTLEMASPSGCDRETVLRALFDQLNYYMDLCLSRPGELIEELSEVWAHKQGDIMKVSSGDNMVEGRFSGIGASGELILRTASGDSEIVQGEIIAMGEDV